MNFYFLNMAWFILIRMLLGHTTFTEFQFKNVLRQFLTIESKKSDMITLSHCLFVKNSEILLESCLLLIFVFHFS